MLRYLGNGGDGHYHGLVELSQRRSINNHTHVYHYNSGRYSKLRNNEEGGNSQHGERNKSY